MFIRLAVLDYVLLGRTLSMCSALLPPICGGRRFFWDAGSFTVRGPTAFTPPGPVPVWTPFELRVDSPGVPGPATVR